jgi:hypothetical protein
MPILLFIIPIHDSIENSNYGSGDYKSRSLSYVQFIRTMSYNFMPSPMLVFFCQLWTDNPMEFHYGLQEWCFIKLLNHPMLVIIFVGCLESLMEVQFDHGCRIGYPGSLV